MKCWSTKALGAVAVAAVLSVALSGCKPYVALANELSASANDERCVVLGSNMPSRKCRTDATMLSPGARESTISGGQVQLAGQK